MSVRVRTDGRILCGAMHPAEEGDCYIDDGVHYILSVDLRVLVTEPWEKHRQRGEWWWKDRIPADVEVDPFYLE